MSIQNLENWVFAIFTGTGSNPMQRGQIRSSLLGSESNRRWGDQPSLRSWLWLRKLSQVKVPSQSQAASQTRFITSSSVGFLPKERRTYPTSLHWIASSGWKKIVKPSNEPINNFENWVVAIFSGTGSNPMQRGRIRSSLLGSESNRRWGDKPSLWSWLWLGRHLYLWWFSQSGRQLSTKAGQPAWRC